MVEISKAFDDGYGTGRGYTGTSISREAVKTLFSNEIPSIHLVVVQQPMHTPPSSRCLRLVMCLETEVQYLIQK